MGEGEKKGKGRKVEMSRSSISPAIPLFLRSVLSLASFHIDTYSKKTQI